MKNINKMLDNSAYIYANRQNLVLAIEDSNGLKNKVVKLVGLLRSNANSYDIKNLFDNMLIIDQTIKSFADNISADVDKQLAGITEQGFLDKNADRCKPAMIPIYYPEAIRNKSAVNIVLGIAGNKDDLYENKEVDEEEGRKLANEYNAIFQLTSA